VILDNDGSRLNWSITADATVTEGTPATYTVGYTGAPLATGITETITVATGNGWTAGRDMPAPSGKTFRELYAMRRRQRSAETKDAR